MKCNNCNAVQATPLLSCPDPAVCGAPFCPQKMEWKRPEPTAIYADKVFSSHRAEGSSIFYPLNTANDPDNFLSVYELAPCSAGCCCPTKVLSEDAVFEIQETFVQLDCLSVKSDACSCGLSPENVTVNGEEVCRIKEDNGLFKADISCILNKLINPVCTAQGLPSKAFLLLQDIGNLEFRIRLGLEGVVRSCGVLYRFKAYIANNDSIQLPRGLTTSFAVAEVNIPCLENGSAPVITFRFDGRVELINPRLSVVAVEEAGGCDNVKVNVSGTLALIPRVTVEVVRNTLILVDAAELKDCNSCGMDGFNLFAGGACCNRTFEEVAEAEAGGCAGNNDGSCGCPRTGNNGCNHVNENNRGNGIVRNLPGCNRN